MCVVMETGGDKFVMEMVAKEHTSSQKGERALGRTAVNFIIVAVIVICFSQGTVAMTTCTETEIQITLNETVTKCCTTCPKGYGVDIECSLQNDTKCENCISGKTYSDVNSHEEPCKICATCDNNTNFILHPCNATQNTICGCPDGYYYDQEADKCKLCDLCPAGWGALRKCNTYHNTICTQCESSVTFSNKLDYYSVCENCMKCVDPYFALQECSITEDTICMNKGIIQNMTPYPKYNYSTPTVYTTGDDEDGSIIPVYCSVLGLVVIGLLVYVIVKHYRRMRTKRRHKAPCSHEDVEYAKAAGGDSGVFVEHDYPQCYSYCLSSRVRDLPVSKRKEMEKILSSPHSDGWKFLAKELGYSDKRMSHFESKRNTDTNSSFKHMLHDWERRDMATVCHLIQCLKNIGREDVARVLYIDSTEARTQLLAKQHSLSQGNMV